MTEKVEFPLANCELRSFVGEDARLYLSLEVVEICNDPVNNCTWYFEPEMGDNHDARTRNQTMDRQAQS